MKAVSKEHYKILLMIPINRSYVVTQSLGLGYVAAVSRRAGHEVGILHCQKEKFTFEDFEKYIGQHEYDMIAIQMFTFDITPVKRHLRIIKEKNPAIITVVGGYHPSGDPQGVLKTLPDADFAFASEVEIAFPRFLSELSKSAPDFSQVPNLIWMDGGQVRANPVQVVENLDEIPFPAWDLMDPNTYPEAPHGAFFKSFPTAPIIITRGCPMTCTFCAGKSITTSNIRKRTIPNVIEEVKFLKDKYGVNDFLVEDENFTLHRKLVMEFCNSLLDENLNITWGCPSGVRLDTLNLEVLKLMEKSGCHSLAVGVEFGSQRILDLTKKKLTLEKIKEKVALFRHTKIKTTGFFLFGIPGETKEEMLQTAKFAQTLDIDRAQFNNFMPLPGSEIYDTLTKDGMAEINFDNFFVHDVAYVPEGMTKAEMKSLQKKAYLGFYLRPKIIFRLLKEITSIKHFFYLMRRFVDAVR